jgi:hypothetical protein
VKTDDARNRSFQRSVDSQDWHEMKESENNQIDLLLRSLAKRERSRSISATSESTGPTGAHLDADELNAFAEQVLPPASRARYMTHLADCTRCRKIVGELSAAAGLAVPQVIQAEISTSFGQRLASLLSPPVLRYAVPALAILAVISVGVLTLRQQSRTEFVAKNQEAQAPPVAVTRTDLPDSSATPAPAAGIITSPKKAPDATTAKTEVPAKDGETSAVATGAAATSADAISPPSKSDVGREAPKAPITTDGQLAKQPPFAPEPAGAAPGARVQNAAPSVSAKNEAVEKQKEQTQTGVAAARDANNERATQDKDVSDTRSRKAAALGRGGSGIMRKEPPRQEAEEKRADEDSEIRTVEGRRFRRRGNAWIDTAYDESRPTLTVARGSEQYRALVADEPAIRSIAEKLSGEVVIVWKGRAYRIR